MVKPEVKLLITDASGQYIPKEFVQDFFIKGFTDPELIEKSVSYFTDINPDWCSDCLDSDNEFYWDSWTMILNNARIVLDGEEYYLYQDGDLWLIPASFQYCEHCNHFLEPEKFVSDEYVCEECVLDEPNFRR